MTAQPLKLRRPTRLRVVDDACKSLEDAILSGQMLPGERLVEATIAANLGVSRTTVREALLMLQQRGLVVTEPRRGTFVTRPSPSDALDLKMVRALLEGFAVRLGWQYLDDALVAAMETLLAEMQACRIPDDFPRIIQVDLALHRLLVERAGSPRLLNLWTSLNGQIGALMLVAVERSHATVEDVVTFHRRLIDAIRGRDPLVLQETIIDHYVRRGLDADAITSAIERALKALSTPEAPSDAATPGPQPRMSER
ncbi:MAG TPA: GntR family transcriptional regulator [bacterium]|nr:GntR family transcriptional regulator [bacterium]